MACTGQKLSALTFAPDLSPSDLFYMAEDLGGGIFFERKIELSQFDSRWVNTSGDTMVGALSMGGFQITNLGAPVNPDDATTKTYVDSLVSAGAPPFTDTIPLVKGSVTPTKLLRFEVDGLSVGTRVLTPQDADYIIAGTNISNDFTVNQTVSARIFLSDGDAANPSYSFTNDLSTGMYRAGLFALGLSAGGLELLKLDGDNSTIIAAVTIIPGNVFVDLGLPGTPFRNLWLSGNVDVGGSASFASNLFAIDAGGNTIIGDGQYIQFGTLGNQIADIGGSLEVNTHWTPTTDNSFDLGKAAQRWRDLWLSGNVQFPDNIRQTFNPGATVAGFNFGSVVADPSTPINGDAWYESTANELRFRIGGATVSFSASSLPPFTDTNALIKGSADPTKLFRFEVDGFTAGVTRVLTPQNADYIIAGTNIANTFSVTQTFAPSTVNSSMILGTTYSLTGSSAVGMIDLAGTWNTSGTPTAIKLNITNTASNAASLLLDLQASTVSKFKVSAVGMTTISRVQTAATLNNTDAHLLIDNTSASGQTMMVFQINGTIQGGVRVDNAGNFNWHCRTGAYHQFYASADTSVGIAQFSSTGVAVGGAAGVASVARLDVISKATTNIGQILKQFAGQTENMLQVRDSANTVLARLTAGGGFVFNENAADVDTRIEGDTDANLFFTDASTDRVGIGIATPLAKLHVAGGVYMATAGALSIASGTNQRAGNAVLVAGTVTVANTTVTANTIVMLTRKTAGGTVGTLITYTVTAATSFTINSDSALDTSTFSYMLIEVP